MRTKKEFHGRVLIFTGGMKKWAPLIIVLLLALAVFLVKTFSKSRQKDPKTPVAEPSRERGFDRRTSFLEYSKHAKCRMECREISTSEVEEIMKIGKVNYRKSDLKNARCPTYAIEGRTSDTQDVRIVFAQCNEKTVVVTVIDLDTDFECSCPGDDKKFKNRN